MDPRNVTATQIDVVTLGTSFLNLKLPLSASMSDAMDSKRYTTIQNAITNIWNTVISLLLLI